MVHAVMVKGKIRTIVKYLAGRLSARGIDVDSVILFGSGARGKCSRDSDIDIIIISDSFRGKDIFKRAEMIGPAEMETIKKYMVPFDIIMKTRAEYDSGNSIIADYAREEGVYVSV